MTKGIAASRYIKQRKREDRKKSSKVKMELISEEQRAGKRSYGKPGRKKKFRFLSREIDLFDGHLQAKGSTPRVSGKKLRQSQARLLVKRMETELANMKVQGRDSAESLMGAKMEANQAEGKLEELTTTRDALMNNLWEMKAAEAFLMDFI